MAGRSARILTVLAAHGLAFLPVTAHASSWFNLGDSSPLRAKAHLDFTIVVPEIIQLANRSESDQSAARNGISPLPHPRTGTIAVAGDPRSSLVAYVNSGTLAFQRASSPAVHRIGRKHATVAFVVSVP